MEWMKNVGPTTPGRRWPDSERVSRGAEKPAISDDFIRVRASL